MPLQQSLLKILRAFLKAKSYSAFFVFNYNTKLLGSRLLEYLSQLQGRGEKHGLERAYKFRRFPQNSTSCRHSTLERVCTRYPTTKHKLTVGQLMKCIKLHVIQRNEGTETNRLILLRRSLTIIFTHSYYYLLGV